MKGFKVHGEKKRKEKSLCTVLSWRLERKFEGFMGVGLDFPKQL